MIKIQVDFFLNREQTVPGNKNWSRGGGAFSMDLSLTFSPRCRAFSSALHTEKVKKHCYSPAPLGQGLQMHKSALENVSLSRH